jgi:hypothetical protein
MMILSSRHFATICYGSKCSQGTNNTTRSMPNEEKQKYRLFLVNLFFLKINK